MNIAEYNHQALAASALGLKKYLQKIFHWADIFMNIAEYNHQALAASALGLKNICKKYFIGRTFL